jgi:hypothetical protein
LQVACLSSSFLVKKGAALLEKMAQKVASGAYTPPQAHAKHAVSSQFEKCRISPQHKTEAEEHKDIRGDCAASVGAHTHSAHQGTTVSRDQRVVKQDQETDSRRGHVHCGYDDVTFVTAALDIGRRHGNVTFQDDYIGNLIHLLDLGCKVIQGPKHSLVRVCE